MDNKILETHQSFYFQHLKIHTNNKSSGFQWSNSTYVSVQMHPEPAKSWKKPQQLATAGCPLTHSRRSRLRRCRLKRAAFPWTTKASAAPSWSSTCAACTTTRTSPPIVVILARTIWPAAWTMVWWRETSGPILASRRASEWASERTPSNEEGPSCSSL